MDYFLVSYFPYKKGFPRSLLLGGTWPINPTPFGPATPHPLWEYLIWLFSKYDRSNSLLQIFGSLSPKIIVVLAENQYHGRFKAIKSQNLPNFLY